MKNIFKYLMAFLLFASFISCEEEIELPLKDDSGKIVIEGKIDDTPGPYFIKVSKSVKISSYLGYEGHNVSDAHVVINDNHGQTEVLEYYYGNYITNNFTTKPGDTYTLSVIVDGKEYISTSTMPQKVNLDAIEYIVNNDHFPFKNMILPIYSDPIEKGDFYHFKITNRSGSQQVTALVNDEIGNGEVNAKYIYLDRNFFKKDDIVEVEMNCIGKPVYEYLKALSMVKSDEDNGSVVPANPVNNINNGALGYFSAQTVSTKNILIE